MDVRMDVLVRDGRPGGVSLTFQLSPKLYQEVDRAEEFNLAVGLREDVDGPAFSSRSDVRVEARLHPQFYESIAPFTGDLALIETYLRDLVAQQPDHPLLSTSSWLAIEVSQNGPGGASRYRTFWHRLRISSNTFERIQQGDFQQEIQEFIRRKIGVEMSQFPQALLDSDVEQFADQVSQAATESVREIFAGIGEELSGEDEEDSTDTADDADPLPHVARFLEDDGWSWQPGDDGVSLLTGVTGENGSFLCRIVWEATNRYLIAYAVLPVAAPFHYRPAMMEYVTRANYGLPSGAFEIDLNDGEVRFRNTLFVEYAFPTEKQITELLYTVVYTADDYLPGILRVNDGVSPQIALAEVEGT